MKSNRFSFSKLLQNDRLMIVLSVICAIWLWYFVLSGSGNVTTRTLTCTMNPAGAKNGVLQVMDTDAITVEVELQGTWSNLKNLTADDIRVQLNTSDIQSAGTCRIHVLAGSNSQATGYDIASVSPATVSLFCDEWTDNKVLSVEDGSVTVEAPGVTAEGDDLDIGAVRVDEASLPGGVVYVRGPLSVVNKIDRLAVRVADEIAITEQQTIAGTAVALDATGAEVDLKYCELMRYDADPETDENAALTALTVDHMNVVFTVNERRDITFTCGVKNAPEGVNWQEIVSISPKTVTLEGEKALLAQYADQIAELTTIDFDTLSVSEKSRIIPLTLPEGITVVGSGDTQLEIKLNFNWSGYTTRTFTWEIGSRVADSPIRFQNVPTGKNVSMLTNKLTVTVCGKRETLDKLRAADLTATVDMSDSSLGTYAVRPTLPGGDAWVYYGESGYTVYLSID